jgi:predicted ATPase
MKSIHSVKRELFDPFSPGAEKTEESATVANPGTSSPRGSEWHRWDPHIHAPGTLLNDQFAGGWESYLQEVEGASSPVRALGVTDYFCIQTYREARKRKTGGRLPGVDFLFPNVELRLDVKTERKRAINAHLLFSPEDPDHEAEIERILRRLTFEFDGRTYHCTLDDLGRLGRAFSPQQTDVQAAIREGANQFKVSLQQLREVLRSEAWLVKNCLVAIPASSTDGTSGIQQDDSFTAVRREIERMAHIIFSGTPSQREFWLGKKPGADRAYIEQNYRALKPCLHGSDAHDESEVATPDHNRLCWIKGDLTFEALRQAVIEPEDRVWIGLKPPAQPTPSSCIGLVQTDETPWLETRHIEINSGLVAVIGARGSGKTALVDMMALAANAMAAEPGASSFLQRASSPIDHLKNGRVELVWGDGSTSDAPLGLPAQSDSGEWLNVNACYLSQHFVERLCSSAGLATELRDEMERLVFEATDPTERLEAESFDQLASISLEPIRGRRVELQRSIHSMSDEIVREEFLRDGLPKMRKEREALKKQIETDRKQLQTLLPKGKEQRVQQLAQIEQARRSVEATVENLRLRRKTLGDLSAEVEHTRSSVEPGRYANMRRKFAAAALDAADWGVFQMVFAGDVDGVLTRTTRSADEAIRVTIEGNPRSPIDPAIAPLAAWPLTMLRSRCEDLKKEVGIDAQQQKKYDELQRAIGQNDIKLKRLETEIRNAEGADERRQQVIQTRRKEYARALETFVEEESVLRELYAPLGGTLEGAQGALAKLQFVVKREVDLAQWVRDGEALLDLRNSGEFRGHGALLAKATQYLLGAWQDGTAEAVATAMEAFLTQFRNDLLKAIPGSVRAEERPTWVQQVATWLYDASHISINYGIRYDGVAIEQLSPGTRGIVLLLLYLAVDHHDRRPLIIDQPEENLDPNSVFRELVPHFRDARKRRQVIIVTHNANLVVNTDADQVIVATASPNPRGGLPSISYESGSLENPTIRRTVCDILEGGERAFLERERRYRLRWEDGARPDPDNN